jgi:hypothetical protein
MGTPAAPDSPHTFSENTAVRSARVAETREKDRPGGILALPNRFLQTFVSQRYRDELQRYAESVGLERVEMVVDPTVSAVAVDARTAPSDV